MNAAPVSPELNWAYYNTIDGKSYIWDGDSWEVLAVDGGMKKVGRPILIPGGTTFSSVQVVTLFSITDGATIRYTLDDEVIDIATGTIYTGPILVSDSVTVRAIAYKTDMATSELSTESYTILRTAKPVITLTPGTYENSQATTITTATDGATIYWTKDGSVPSRTNYAGTGKNSAAITINQLMTVKAIAVMDGYIDSYAMSADYVISNVVQSPVFYYTNEYFSSSQSVSVSCATTGSVLYYTINDSTPSSTNYEGTNLNSLSFSVSETTTIVHFYEMP